MQALPTPPLSATHPHPSAQLQSQAGPSRADQPPFTYRPIGPQGTQQIFQFPPNGMSAQQQQVQVLGPVQLQPAPVGPVFQQPQPQPQVQPQSRPGSTHGHGQQQQQAQSSRHQHHHRQAPHPPQQAQQQHAPQQQQPQPPPPANVQPVAVRQAYADANALLQPTRNGLIGVFDGLLAATARELQGRQEELDHARSMNNRIERDYRDLYRLAISLQRIEEQLRGEVELLRLRKGADGGAVAAFWKGHKGREDRLWGAVDRCIQQCQCGAAKATLSDVVLLKRSNRASSSSSSSNAQPRPHTSDRERRPSTQSSTSMSVSVNTQAQNGAHRRFSTGSTTIGSPVVSTSAQGPHSAFQSPVVQGGPSTFASPVVPTGPAMFQSPVTGAHQSPVALNGSGTGALNGNGVSTVPVFNGGPVPQPQAQSRPSTASRPPSAVQAGAFHIPVPPNGAPIVVAPPVVPSQQGVQPVVPQPQPYGVPLPPTQSHVVPSQLHPSHVPVPGQAAPAHVPGLTPEQLLQLAEHPSQAQNRNALRMQAMSMIHRQNQGAAGQQSHSQPLPVPIPQMGMASAAGFVAAATDANGQALAGLPAYPERPPAPQPSSSQSSSSSSSPQQSENRSTSQTLLNLPKAARMALVGLNDPRSPLRDALRLRAGLPASAPPSSAPSVSLTSPTNPNATPAPSDVRARLLAELGARLRTFSPQDALILLNLGPEKNRALAALSGGGSEEDVRAIRALEGVQEEIRAVEGLVRAVCAEEFVGVKEEARKERKERRIKREKGERVTIDLTLDEIENADADGGEAMAFTDEPEEMDVEHYASTSTAQPEVPQSSPRATDDSSSPSRRRARSDSGVGTDISDTSGSGAGEGRAVKRARLSLDDNALARSELEEGEIVSPHLAGERQIQQTLTPDATPRLRAATARMVEREEAPGKQGSIDPRALTDTTNSQSHPPSQQTTTALPAMTSGAKTAFVNNFLQSFTEAENGEKTDIQQILGAIAKAQSASGVVEGIVEAAYAGNATPRAAVPPTPRVDVPPPTTPTPAPPPPLPVSSAPPMERTRSVPIEPATAVPVSASAPVTPAEYEPSPFVQGSSGAFDPGAFVQGHSGEPDHSPVLQSEELLRMRQQSGYNGPYTGPPHPYELQQQYPMAALQHVPVDLEGGHSGELPRLPDDKPAEMRVLGPDHLALLYEVEEGLGGWACRLCLARKEADESWPVPVYSTGDGSMPDQLRTVMSAHCAETHAGAYAHIAGLDDEEARAELRDMMDEE
ncbi:unnamed protein product [Peniophora sp. CBMAI 1063]|nr:unnamed protein product [Peniophora sp. CBMAI 1063]